MGKKNIPFRQNQPMRWQAARMDGRARNRGITNVRKQPKGKGK